MRETTYDINYIDNHNVHTKGHRTCFRDMYSDAKYLSKVYGKRVTADYRTKHGTVITHIIYTFVNGKLTCKDAFDTTYYHGTHHYHTPRR